MTAFGSPTGVLHAQIHKTHCAGAIEYNGAYSCNVCGKDVSPRSHPAVYAGLFNYRYPGGRIEDFEQHPNFDRERYEDGKRELADLAGVRA